MIGRVAPAQSQALNHVGSTCVLVILASFLQIMEVRTCNVAQSNLHLKKLLKKNFILYIIDVLVSVSVYLLC